jgi:hypothetical protein
MPLPFTVVPFKPVICDPRISPTLAEIRDEGAYTRSQVLHAFGWTRKEMRAKKLFMYHLAPVRWADLPGMIAETRYLGAAIKEVARTLGLARGGDA